MLEGARKAYQGHEGGDAHGNAAQREQRSETPAPEVPPGESRERKLGGHGVGTFPRVDVFWGA